jgi:phosphate transport system protein
MINAHTVKAFDADLAQLQAGIARLAGIAERTFAAAVADLIKVAPQGRAAAEIAAERNDIESLAVLTIARRQPLADDLRATVAAMWACQALHRVGDLAAEITRHGASLDRAACPPEAMREIEHLGGVARTQLASMVEAYLARNIETTLAVLARRRDVAVMHESVVDALVAGMQARSVNAEVGSRLVLCADAIADTGGAVSRLAEAVYYLIEGRPMVWDIFDALSAAETAPGLPLVPGASLPRHPSPPTSAEDTAGSG